MGPSRLALERAAMKEFSIEAFADHLAGLGAGMPVLEEIVLEHIGLTVERAAKDKIGEYQAESGPFEAWPSLAESTKEDRLRKGYSEDDPGLRSGAMRDSIEHVVLPGEVHIGSNDDDLLWFELGTSKQPPRSVIGAAAFEKTPLLMAEAGAMLEGYLAGEKLK
jgi:hypothetical protein